MGCANSGWGALIFDEIQISENLRGGYFMRNFSGASRRVFVDFTSKNCRNLKISNTKMSIFGALRAQNAGGANSARGALIFTGFSKSEIFWGALILNEKSPEMAGVR